MSTVTDGLVDSATKGLFTNRCGTYDSLPDVPDLITPLWKESDTTDKASLCVVRDFPGDICNPVGAGERIMRPPVYVYVRGWLCNACVAVHATYTYYICNAINNACEGTLMYQRFDRVSNGRSRQSIAIKRYMNCIEITKKCKCFTFYAFGNELRDNTRSRFQNNSSLIVRYDITCETLSCTRNIRIHDRVA